MRSHTDPTLYILMIEALACIELREAPLDLGEKAQAFNRLFDAGILREIVEGLQDPLLACDASHTLFITGEAKARYHQGLH